MQPNLKPIFNDLFAYGVKKWGKQTIDDWLKS
jgi:hypothetical protein